MSESILGNKVYAVPNEWLQEVGAIHVLWGCMDHCVETIIWNLLGLDKRSGPAITSSADTSARLTMLTKVMKHKYDRKAQYQDVLDAVKIIRENTDLRNYLAHGDWMFLKDGTTKNKTPIAMIGSHRKVGGIPNSFKAKGVYYATLVKLRLDFTKAAEMLTAGSVYSEVSPQSLSRSTPAGNRKARQAQKKLPPQ